MIVCCRWEQPAQIIKVKWSHYTWICPEMGSASILINNRILSHLFLGVSRHPTKLSLDLDGISQLSRSLRIPCLQKFTRDMIQRRTVRDICASCGQCGVLDGLGMFGSKFENPWETQVFVILNCIVGTC